MFSTTSGKGHFIADLYLPQFIFFLISYLMHKNIVLETDTAKSLLWQMLDDGVKPEASNKPPAIFSRLASALDMFLRNFTLYLSNSASVYKNILKNAYFKEVQHWMTKNAS